jgi:hypothetical protein
MNSQKVKKLVTPAKVGSVSGPNQAGNVYEGLHKGDAQKARMADRPVHS